MNNNKPFGYIYTDYQNSGALSITLYLFFNLNQKLSKSGDFFLISWSHEFSNTCGNIYDMKCIEDPSVIIMYNNMNIIDIEVFYCDLNLKFCNLKLRIKVSEDMSLEEISLEILGKKAQFIKPRSIQREYINQIKGCN